MPTGVSRGTAMMALLLHRREARLSYKMRVCKVYVWTLLLVTGSELVNSKSRKVVLCLPSPVRAPALLVLANEKLPAMV